LQPRLSQVPVQRARDAAADHHGLPGLSFHGPSQRCLVDDGRRCEVQPWQPHDTDVGGRRLLGREFQVGPLDGMGDTGDSVTHPSSCRTADAGCIL